MWYYYESRKVTEVLLTFSLTSATLLIYWYRRYTCENALRLLKFHIFGIIRSPVVIKK